MVFRTFSYIAVGCYIFVIVNFVMVSTLQVAVIGGSNFGST